MIHIRIPARRHELSAAVSQEIDAFVARLGQHGLMAAITHEEGAITVPEPATRTSGGAINVTPATTGR